jgi:hypothetical protein
VRASGNFRELPGGVTAIPVIPLVGDGQTVVVVVEVSEAVSMTVEVDTTVVIVTASGVVVVRSVFVATVWVRVCVAVRTFPEIDFVTVVVFVRITCWTSEEQAAEICDAL